MSNFYSNGSRRAICPISTTRPCSIQELQASGQPIAEIKAYKLGKRRWSYNQVEVVLLEKGGKRELHSKQALHGGVACEDLGDSSGIKYQITLTNNEVITMVTYLVYDPYPIDQTCAPCTEEGKHDWVLVTRDECKKGCEGSVLRAIQRFGKLGKRTGSNSSTPRTPHSSGLERSNSSMKDSRYMYLSLDEAVTHVGCKCFRLVCGALDACGNLIGTSVSPPIRVLANNDVPTGAAHIEMYMEVESSWPGWESSFTPLELFPPISPAGRDFGSNESDDSLITPKRLSARLRKAASSGQKRFSSMLGELEEDQKVLRRTQSMKKGKTTDCSQLKHTINLTAQVPTIPSPFMQDRDEPEQGRKVNDAGSLALWLEDLNAEFQEAQAKSFIPSQPQYQPHMYDHGYPLYQQPDPQSYMPPPSQQCGGMPTTFKDDPVSAFVHLMMSQSPPKDNVPIVEIPRSDPYTFGQKYDVNHSIGMQCTLPPMNPVNDLGQPPPLATPTESAIDSLLYGVNASTSCFLYD